MQLHAAGLRPTREYRFAPPRRFRFDFAWPSLRIAMEIDGGIWTRGRHTRGAGVERDMEKLNLAAVNGWRVLRFSPRMVLDGSALTTAFRALRSPWR